MLLSVIQKINSHALNLVNRIKTQQTIFREQYHQIFLYSLYCILKDNSPWGQDGFRLINIRIRPTTGKPKKR